MAESTKNNEPEHLGLDLADAFAGDWELLADLFERVVGVHADAVVSFGGPNTITLIGMFGRGGTVSCAQFEIVLFTQIQTKFELAVNANVRPQMAD